MRLPLRTFTCLSLLLLFAGCASDLESQVSGTVTLDGKLMDKGDVIFHPAETGTPAYGSIDAEGNYAVKTGQGEGMKPGEYIVVVKATSVVAPSDEVGAMEVLPELLTPKRYAAKQFSPLRFTVEAGAQTIDLTLESE